MSTGNPNHPNGNVKLDLALDDIIKSGRPQKGSSTVPRAEKSRKWEHDMFSRKKRDHQHRRDRHHRGPEKRHATNWGYLIKISNLHWEVTKDDVKKFLESLQDCPPLGQISIIYDKSGRSEGICHIKVRSMDHAKKMISLLSDKEINGSPITAAIGNEQEPPSNDAADPDGANKMVI